jgi:squalene cyclase
MARAVDSMREQDPQKALQWYKTIGDPEIAQKVAEGLLPSLVRVDRDAALQFAAQMPPEAQPKAYHNMVRGWAFDQPQEAGNWVNSLPGGEARDAAVKAYVSVIDGMDAGAATQWAYTMQEPTERMETTLNVFQRWLQNDRTAAGDWVQQTELPEGFRPFFERLLNDQKYAEHPR